MHHRHHTKETTTQTLGLMREFRTKQFTIRVEALEEPDVDLSWDEDGETRRGLESGQYIVFCAHAVVYCNGRKIGEEYLGNCIYKSLDDFMNHRECGKQNRELAAQGKEGRCGSYFADMIHVAIAETRKTLAGMQRVYVRPEVATHTHV